MQILISGGYRKHNPEVYKFLTEKKRKIAYIPAWFGSAVKRDIKRFINQFDPSEVSEIKSFRLDLMETEEDLFSFDVIYLDGGNTYFVLEQLKRLKLMNKFRNFAKNKILVGMSAGCLVQTPTIKLASIPKFDADERINSVKDSALALVDFEVYPHFETDAKNVLRSLKNYSKTHDRKIYLLPDGSSIFKNGKALKFIGEYLVLQNGVVTKV